MQLASFRITNGGRKTIGAFVGHCYVDLHALTGGQLPADMLAFLQLGDTPGLPPRDIRRLQTPRVVLVLRLAVGIRRCRERIIRRPRERFEIGIQQ